MYYSEGMEALILVPVAGMLPSSDVMLEAKISSP